MHRLARIGWGMVGWAAFLSSTMVHGIGILVSVAMFWDRDRRFALTALRWSWGYLNIWLDPIWGIEHRGVDRIGQGPYIIVSNHQSVADIPSIARLPIPMRLVAREGVAKVPIMGTFLHWGRHVVSSRLLEDGSASLAAGISLLIFPEGTRSIDGEIGRFRGGAFHLAKHTGALLLPVVTDEGRFIVPKQRWLPDRWPVTVKVQVLDPIDPADFENARDLKHHVRQVMLAAKEAL